MTQHTSPFHINSIATVGASVIGWLVLAGVFFRALLNPFVYTDFIYDTSILLYVTEFLNIHASGMLQGASHQSGKQLYRPFLLLLYGFFIFIFFFVFKNTIMLIFFAVSLVSKVLSYRTSADPHQSATRTMLLLGTTLPLVVLSPIIAFLFPFPAEFLALKPANTSGLFVEMPQVVLVWGILYSLANIGLEIHFVRPHISTTLQH